MTRSCWSFCVLLFRFYFLALLLTQLLVSLAQAEKGKADYASYLQAATESREQIEAAQQELESSLDVLFTKLDSAIQTIQPGDFVGERLAIAELRKLIPLLRQEAVSIIEAHEAYRAAAQRYGEQLDEARPVVQEAVTAFREYAANEPYQDLQEQYHLIAESFLAINAKYQQQKEQVAPSISAVTANLDYTRHTVLFLERLEQFLVVMPSDSPNLERFLNNLARYVKAFEKLRSQLKQFHRATAGGIHSGSSKDEEKIQQDENSNITQGTKLSKVPAQFALLRSPRSAEPTHSSRLINNIISENHDSFDDFTADGELFGKPAPATKTWDLNGRWVAGNGTVSYRIAQQGTNITVSLLRSAKVKSVQGRLRLQGNNLQVDALSYHLATGKTINLSQSTWQVENANLIRCTAPTFSRDARGNYIPTRSFHSFKLRRIR